MTSERYLIRTLDGPVEGTRWAPPDWTWPLPDILDTPQGVYRKVSESQLPPHEGIARGAAYQFWPHKDDE